MTKKAPFTLILFVFLLSYSVFTSCSPAKQISRSADKLLITDSAISKGFIGISIYDPAADKYLYNYNADKYFVPASNTKLFTLYAGMKFLGDSLVGLRYLNTADTNITFIQPTGDPTFLHTEFHAQPVFDFLKAQRQQIAIEVNAPKFNPYGRGWNWDDLTEDYALPRTEFPMYGQKILANKPREILLYDTLGRQHPVTTKNKSHRFYALIHSQPSDSMFKPMMHRSDNYFAEQTLLMAANEFLGYMSDEKMIDTILKTFLKDIPQKPRWVDGSGLSRYNLITPQAFVYLLNIMKNEFGLERMEVILPTGGQGTLKNYYLQETGVIFAKTGTLSNNCALSGYLITKKSKLLVFSIIANNYQTGATPVRKAVELFLRNIRQKY